MKLRFFNIAKIVSRLSTYEPHSIGSCIVRKNKLISVGYNQFKTHPKSPHSHKHIHAEFKAIITANPEDLRGASIYVYREDRNGNKAISKPCSSCYELIKQVGIKAIHYTENNGYMTEIL